MTTTDPTRRRPSGSPHPDADPRHAANLERVIGDLYELYDLGALEHFEHLVEPHPHRADLKVDVFRLIFPGGRQTQMPYAQVRAYLRGFYAGRDHPRAGTIADAIRA